MSVVSRTLCWRIAWLFALLAAAPVAAHGGPRHLPRDAAPEILNWKPDARIAPSDLDAPAETVQSPLWGCPVCAGVRLKDPGACPACGRDLWRMGAQAGAVAPPPERSEVWGCPMCETVRQPVSGRCSMCGMDLVRMADPREVSAEASMQAGPPGAKPRPLMPGLPNWLFFGIAILILAVSFALFEVWGRKARGRFSGARFDMFRIPGLKAWLKKPWFQLSLQLPVLFLFALVIAAGFFGDPSPERNIAPVLTWTIWWAWLVFLILFMGKLWCTACPWMAVSDWIARSIGSYGIRWPGLLRNIWPATGLFVFLTWLELGYGVTEKPWLTAAMGLVMLALAVGSVVIFERKAFCRYACLVGRVSGLYSMFSSSELRAANRGACKGCVTKDCYRGNELGQPCPTHQFLPTMDANTYCILCMECVKACPEDNVAWNARPFGSDLVESVKPRIDEAYLAVIMLSMSAFHGLTMTLAWDKIVDAIDRATGAGWLAAFSLGMIGMLVLPLVVYYGVCVLMKAFARDREHGAGEIFVRFAYSLLPIALFYHLAHNLQHIFFEGKKLIRAASDPFGHGWDLFGTAHMPIDAVLPLHVGWGIQVSLILIGHVYGIYIAHKAAQSLYDDPRAATASQIPMLAAMLLFSFQSLWLLSQPMLMRTAM
jgi:hypothetical protein